MFSFGCEHRRRKESNVSRNVRHMINNVFRLQFIQRNVRTMTTTHHFVGSTFSIKVFHRVAHAPFSLSVNNRRQTRSKRTTDFVHKYKIWFILFGTDLWCLSFWTWAEVFAVRLQTKRFCVFVLESLKCVWPHGRDLCVGEKSSHIESSSATDTWHQTLVYFVASANNSVRLLVPPFLSFLFLFRIDTNGQSMKKTRMSRRSGFTTDYRFGSSFVHFSTFTIFATLSSEIETSFSLSKFGRIGRHSIFWQQEIFSVVSEAEQQQPIWHTHSLLVWHFDEWCSAVEQNNPI